MSSLYLRTDLHLLAQHLASGAEEESQRATGSTVARVSEGLFGTREHEQRFEL